MESRYNAAESMSAFDPLRTLERRENVQSMIRANFLLFFLAAGCSQGEQASAPLRKGERVAIQLTKQDPRCREAVANGLAPGSFDYGVVSTAATAKEVAHAYFSDIFAYTDTPVGQVLRRPLTAELRDGIWHVVTTVPKGAVGVQLFMQICQSNGRVLQLTGSQ